MRHPLLRPGRAVAALALLLPAAACTWSVPADPGRNHRERAGAPPAVATSGVATSAGTVAVADPGARALYEQKCGACHVPFAPRSRAAADWPGLVRHYGPRAGLFGAERARVLGYLQAAAR